MVCLMMFFLDLDARQNILAYRFGELYKHLYNKGCIWSGPKDYNELYNCDYTLENRFDLPISVIRLGSLQHYVGKLGDNSNLPVTR